MAEAGDDAVSVAAQAADGQLSLCNASARSRRPSRQSRGGAVCSFLHHATIVISI